MYSEGKCNKMCQRFGVARAWVGKDQCGKALLWEKALYRNGSWCESLGVSKWLLCGICSMLENFSRGNYDSKLVDWDAFPEKQYGTTENLGKRKP